MKSLDENYMSDSDMVLRYKNEMMVHCNTVSKWAEENSDRVREQASQVGEFWSKTYKADMPTGMTPKPKRYSYPKTLTLTINSPRKRLSSSESEVKESGLDLDSELGGVDVDGDETEES
jgi:hypothetical protein